MTSHSHSQPRCIRVSRCHRHPSKPITGFCASCLRERLASIDSATRHEIPIPTASSSSAALRRTKSYSASSSAAVSDPPRRKSCDVRSRNTLSDLFSIHDHDQDAVPRGFEVEELGFQLREEDENEEQQEEVEDEDEEEEEEEEIRVSEAPNVQEDENVELKTMKEFIDLEWQPKKRNGGMDFKHIVWEAASVFTKKLSKWRRKQSKKNTKNDCDTVDADIDRRARRWRETQSEIGDYGFGRGSCDTDPRFSVDAAAARYSFDEPRASWDGYLIGARAFPNPNPRQLSPLVSVVEDVNQSRLSLDLTSPPPPPPPGGSAQTKDYYLEMSRTTRRRSFDRSNSRCNKEVDDLKLISNAKVSPATTELFYGAKLLIADQNLRDTNGSESVDSGSKESDVSQSGFNKLGTWHKVRNIFNFKPHRRRNERDCGNGNEEKYVEGNMVDRSSFGESWQKLRRVANGEANGNGSVSQKLIRSYSVSCRNPCKVAGLFNHSEPKSNGVKRREEVILQHSRSARYSPNNLDHNGLLRFYLTPLRSYRRSKSGKSKLRSSSSIARTVL